MLPAPRGAHWHSRRCRRDPGRAPGPRPRVAAADEETLTGDQEAGAVGDDVRVRLSIGLDSGDVGPRCHTIPSRLVANAVAGVGPLAVHTTATNPLGATTTVPTSEPNPAWMAAVSAAANVTPPSADTHAAACTTSPTSVQPVTTTVGLAGSNAGRRPLRRLADRQQCGSARSRVTRIATTGSFKPVRAAHVPGRHQSACRRRQCVRWPPRWPNGLLGSPNVAPSPAPTTPPVAGTPTSSSTNPATANSVPCQTPSRRR